MSSVFSHLGEYGKLFKKKTSLTETVIELFSTLRFSVHETTRTKMLGLACSRRSDSGARAKNKASERAGERAGKKRGETGGEFARSFARFIFRSRATI